MPEFGLGDVDVEGQGSRVVVIVGAACDRSVGQGAVQNVAAVLGKSSAKVEPTREAAKRKRIKQELAIVSSLAILELNKWIRTPRLVRGDCLRSICFAL